MVMGTLIPLGILVISFYALYRVLKGAGVGLWYIAYTNWKGEVDVTSMACFTRHGAETEMMLYHPDGWVISSSERDQLLRERRIKALGG